MAPVMQSPISNIQPLSGPQAGEGGSGRCEGGGLSGESGCSGDQDVEPPAALTESTPLLGGATDELTQGQVIKGKNSRKCGSEYSAVSSDLAILLSENCSNKGKENVDECQRTCNDGKCDVPEASQNCNNALQTNSCTPENLLSRLEHNNIPVKGESICDTTLDSFSVFGKQENKCDLECEVENLEEIVNKSENANDISDTIERGGILKDSSTQTCPIRKINIAVDLKGDTSKCMSESGDKQVNDTDCKNETTGCEQVKINAAHTKEDVNNVGACGLEALKITSPGKCKQDSDSPLASFGKPSQVSHGVSSRTKNSNTNPPSSSVTAGVSLKVDPNSCLRKISAPARLDPIGSSGRESSNKAHLTVNTNLITDTNGDSTENRSPCTPTSGCLKAGSRSTGSGAHVQFETPCDNKDSLLLHDTTVSADGQVTLNKPGSGNASPTRLWAKFNPESSLSEIASSLARPRKGRRRHVSGSSSISFGSNSSDSTDSHATELERRAPDGGWGWVIVAASFMVHCIADGVTMSFGVLFVELLNYFQEGKSLTSWVGSLFMAIPLLAGPLASLLTDRYGCRTVTICGAVVACIGFFVSAFVKTIPLLLVTVGIITGLGLAVCYVAAIVIVAFYFEKKRSLATGIAVAGSGIGTFLFAPLIQYLVDNYGWRLCFIFLAGIFLNMVVCGVLMQDLEWTPRQRHHSRDANTTVASSRRSSTSNSSETVGGRASIGTTLPSLDELRRLVQSGDVAALLSPDDPPSEKLRGSASLVLLPTFLSRSQVLPPDVIPCLSSRTNAYEVVSQMYPHLLSHSLSGHVNQVEQTQVSNSKKQQPKCQREKTVSAVEVPFTKVESPLFNDKFVVPNSQQQLATPESLCDTDSTTPDSSGCILSVNGQARKRIDVQLGCSLEQDDGDDADNEEEYEEVKEITAMLDPARFRGPRQPGSRRISSGCMGTTSPPLPAAPLRNMRVNKQSMTFRGAMLNIHRYRLRASSCPDIYRNSIITIAKSQDETVWTYLDDMGEMFKSCVDYSYCLDAAYLIFALSNFVLYVFYDTVYMYLTDYAQGVGVSADDSANLISAIGILNCVGMVVMGYVGDQPWSSPMLIYNFSMVLCGISVIAMPFITNYWLLAAAAAIFGLFISANYALTSVILVEIITLEAFSKAYGLLLLIQGVANLIGPPIVGLLADTTGDYMAPFVVSGFFIVVCGVLLNAIPLVQRCQDRHQDSYTSSPVGTPKKGSPTPSPNHMHKKSGLTNV